MFTAILQPNTKRLKQLIHDFGNEWIVTHRRPRKMPCFDGKLGWGISSIDGKHFRNVHSQDLKF